MLIDLMPRSKLFEPVRARSDCSVFVSAVLRSASSILSRAEHWAPT